jgi:hypothetical protein
MEQDSAPDKPATLQPQIVMPFPQTGQRMGMPPPAVGSPMLQGLTVPTRMWHQGDVSSSIQFKIDECNAICLMNAHQYYHPFIWASVMQACHNFIGYIDRQLCKESPCRTCGSKEGLLDDWKAEAKSYRDKHDWIAAFWRFTGGRLTSHGYLLQQEAKPLVAVPTERMEAMIPLDASREPADAMAGPLWLANMAFERMLSNRPVFLACDTRSNTDAYRTGKTSLVMQVAYFLGQLITRAGYGKPFDMRHDVVYEHDEPRLGEFIADDTPWCVRVIDEFLILYKRDSMTKRMKKIIKAVPTKPKQRQAWLMAGPNIFDLDKHLVHTDLTHRLKVTVRLKEAMLYEKRGSPPDEAFDQWGDSVVPVSWSPMPDSWERLYDGPFPSLVKIARKMDEESERSPVVEFLSRNKDWGLGMFQSGIPEVETRQVA